MDNMDDASDNQTDAAGLVGQYLLRDLLLQDVPVAVLIRAAGQESASDRLEHVMTHWEGDLGRELPRPVCLEGDITLSGLGLTAEAQRWAGKHCGTVLHNAASLTFQASGPDEEPWMYHWPVLGR